MAVTRVSPGNPDCICSVTKGGKDKFGADATRARDPDDPEIVGVLETAHPGQISSSVAAPVA